MNTPEPNRRSTAWTWRHAIQDSELEPTTKLVLYNLSMHMNERGESCFPSIKEQMRGTGLSNRAVCMHLEKAESAGFIEKQLHGYGGQNWARQEYKAKFPDTTEKAVNDVHHDTAAEEAVNVVREKPGKAVNVVPKAVNVGHTNSPVTPHPERTPQFGTAEAAPSLSLSHPAVRSSEEDPERVAVSLVEVKNEANGKNGSGVLFAFEPEVIARLPDDQECLPCGGKKRGGKKKGKGKYRIYEEYVWSAEWKRLAFEVLWKEGILWAKKDKLGCAEWWDTVITTPDQAARIADAARVQSKLIQDIAAACGHVEVAPLIWLKEGRYDMPIEDLQRQLRNARGRGVVPNAREQSRDAAADYLKQRDGF